MKKMIAIVLALMLCVSALSVVAFAAEGDVTVYAKVPEGWTNVGAYTWSPEDFGSWPGSKMTLNADGWYEITMPGTHTTLIINSDAGQTVDLTIEAGKDVWVTVLNEKDGNNYKADISYDGGNTPAPTPTPDPAPEAYYVAGSAGLVGSEWNVNDANNVMTKGDDGIWTKTYTVATAGSYSLKVTSGDWSKPSWGGDGENGNFDLTVAAGDEVTVKFNPATEKVTVLVNGADANPKTGDMGLVGVSVALLAATAGLVAVVSKKKEF